MLVVVLLVSIDIDADSSVSGVTARTGGARGKICEVVLALDGVSAVFGTVGEEALWAVGALVSVSAASCIAVSAAGESLCGAAEGRGSEGAPPPACVRAVSSLRWMLFATADSGMPMTWRDTRSGPMEKVVSVMIGSNMGVWTWTVRSELTIRDGCCSAAGLGSRDTDWRSRPSRSLRGRPDLGSALRVFCAVTCCSTCCSTASEESGKPSGAGCSAESVSLVGLEESEGAWVWLCMCWCIWGPNGMGSSSCDMSTSNGMSRWISDCISSTPSGKPPGPPGPNVWNSMSASLLLMCLMCSTICGGGPVCGWGCVGKPVSPVAAFGSDTSGPMWCFGLALRGPRSAVELAGAEG